MTEGESEADFRTSHSAVGMDVRDPLPRAIRDPSFPASVRGYDRHAVDAYVERVNRLIAELQVSGSPKAAVRHALERVGEQTSGILQRARETAEEITTSAREEAEETTARARAEAKEIGAAAESEADGHVARARAEAEEIVATAKATADEMLVTASDQAESTISRARVEAEGRVRRSEEEVATLHEQATTRMTALRADIDALSEERQTALDDLRRIAGRLAEVTGVVEEPEPEAQDEVTPAPELAVAAGAPSPDGPDGRADGSA
jgi:DivIVA domain-containing protein